MAITPRVNPDGRDAAVDELSRQLRTPREDLHCYGRAFSHTVEVKGLRRNVLHTQLIKRVLHMLDQPELFPQCRCSVNVLMLGDVVSEALHRRCSLLSGMNCDSNWIAATVQIRA